MIKRLLKSIGILSLMIGYTFIYKYYIFTNLLQYSEYINAAFCIIIAFLSIIAFGQQTDKKTEMKKGVFVTEGILLLGFFTIYYGTGLFTGFLKSPYALNTSSIIYNILALAVIIIAVEKFRYVMITSNKESKMNRFLVTITICIFEIVITVPFNNITNYEEAFKVFAQMVLPIIVKNFTMSYIIRYAGIRPVLLYRFIMDLYQYVVPIVPDIGEYFKAIIKTGLPMALYIISYRIIDDHINGIEYDFKKKLLKKSDIPIIIFILVVSILISGKFQYQLLSIGSGSMSPTINKGDAVLLDKSKNTIKKVKNEDIVAYKKDGILIIHRVIEINTENGKKYYKTKGDANNSADNIILTNKDIVGVVKIRFQYIGYPSVFITENFSK